VHAYGSFEEATSESQGEASIVIADLDPPGRSGVDLIRHARQRWPDAPIIAMSGLQAGIQKALDAGAAAAFAKPFSVHDFWESVRALAGLRTPATPAAQPGQSRLADSKTPDWNGGEMKIEFLSTVAVIAPDPPNSRKLYVDALGLPLDGEAGDYQHSEQIGGCKSFGIWPLSQASEACFGTPEWPAERLVPQVSIEFDVGGAAAVNAAAQELEQAGFALLHPPRAEPWGQTVARLQSPEGAIVGISHIPMFHDKP
jgi:CheY-like chemotaxis protein